MSKSSGPGGIYDVPAEHREILEWKAERRAALRNQYLKEIHSPNSSGSYLFDPQLQRFYSTRFAFEKLHKPTVQNFLWYTFLTVGIIGSFTYWVKIERDKKENRFRTGQVSYRDREFKFT